MKQVIFKEEARRQLCNGINKVADAVRVTLGPSGRNAVLQKAFGGPSVTNDGVSIAKDITLSDAVENMGADIIKEVASKTNDEGGDGTTTAMVLMQEMVRRGIEEVKKGGNAMSIRRGMEKASLDVQKELADMAKPIKGTKAIQKVATISAESEELGKIIGETIEKIGEDGIVTVEESPYLGIESEIVEGLKFDKGYITPYMVNNAEKMEAVYVNVPVLITDSTITNMVDIIHLLDGLAGKGITNLVVICEDMGQEALAASIVNHLKGTFHIIAVKAPGFGENKAELLGDIAITVGATVVSQSTGEKLSDAPLSVLGKTKRIVVTKDSTTIIGGGGKKKEIQERIELLRAQAASSESTYEADKLSKRASSLDGGIAVIKVGGSSELESGYLKDKVDDAVAATQAAISEGVVVGGGVALVTVADKLMNVELPNEDEQVGYQIVLDSLRKPHAQINDNAGGTCTSDAEIVKSGVVDPVKVTRSGVKYSTSAAAMLLTTEVAVADEPVDNE